ncbi:PAS domain S-box protein [Actinoplanes sp. NPDC049265]|uniref:PAS domain-containing sensor histidine kinase n=1 Tax=Actinoplanes sp. NPDC049265 TaxID=3363902 RepID=UPI003720AA93
MVDTLSAVDDGEQTIEDLRRTVDRQRRTIDALVIAAERRTSAEPDSAALATWQRNLTLQRRLAERTERIRAAEQVLRAVIDSIDAGLCILDDAGRIIDTNQVWSAMVARAGDLAGDGCFFSLAAQHGDGLGALLNGAGVAVRQVLAGQKVVPAVAHRVETRDGPRWWRLRVDPVLRHGAARAVLSLTDETHAIRTQDELRQTTREASRLALVARHMDDGVVITDEDGRIEWVNDAFTELTGYTPEEAVGRIRTDLFGIDHIPAFDATALSAKGSMVLPEFESRTKDGRRCWLRVELYRVTDDDGVVRLVGVERDVTARVKAERARLAAKARAEALAHELSVEKAVLTGVISAIPQFIYWKDANGRYLGHNAAFLAIRGLAADAELAWKPEDEINVVDDLTPILGSLEERVRDNGDPVVDHHVSVNGPDGTPRSFLLSVLPQPEAAGVIGIGADVTRIGELERQLNQANRLEAIGQLAAGIAHEINTPIQFISDNTRFIEQSFADLLTLVTAVQQRFGDTDDELAGLLREIDADFLLDEVPKGLAESLEGLERVAQIVRAMKDFSHPGQGRSDVDINRAVESTAHVARNEWKYHAELSLDLGGDVGLVPCYEGELKQVVLNLIVNAAHAIEAAGPRDEGGLGHIRIRTTRGPDTVEIAVSDDGTGMDEATQQRIFDPFFTTKEVGKGTGQGLSMAYSSIVQKHGGAIKVDSAPGAGTTFSVCLPLRADDEAG